MLVLAVASALCLGYYRYTYLDGDLDGVRDWFKDTFILITGVALFFISADRLDHAKRIDRIGFLERSWLRTDDAFIDWRSQFIKFIDMGNTLLEHVESEVEATNRVISDNSSFGLSRTADFNSDFKGMPTRSDAKMSLIKYASTLSFRLKPRSQSLYDALQNLLDDAHKCVDTLNGLKGTAKYKPSMAPTIYRDELVILQAKVAEAVKLLENSLATFELSYTTTRDRELA